VSADRFGKRIDPLKLLRYLLLRQEIGRPDEGDVLEGNLRNSASDGWILRNARNKFIHLVLAKWILFCKRVVAQEAKAELVDQARTENVCPSDRGSLAL